MEEEKRLRREFWLLNSEKNGCMKVTILGEEVTEFMKIMGLNTSKFKRLTIEKWRHRRPLVGKEDYLD